MYLELRPGWAILLGPPTQGGGGAQLLGFLLHSEKKGLWVKQWCSGQRSRVPTALSTAWGCPRAATRAPVSVDIASLQGCFPLPLPLTSSDWERDQDIQVASQHGVWAMSQLQSSLAKMWEIVLEFWGFRSKGPQG